MGNNNPCPGLRPWQGFFLTLWILFKANNRPFMRDGASTELVLSKQQWAEGKCPGLCQSIQ